MTDTGMKGRVKGLLGGPVLITESPERMDVPVDANANTQAQALQVLTLAQRTAEEHVANAQRQADKIFTDARSRAEQIIRDAQAHAHNLRKEADKSLSNARAAAAQMAREAQNHAESVQRNADNILADARAGADQIAKNARSNAEELKLQAQQRYDDVVGSLAAKRETLQQQIEALEAFDQEYRTRLTTFMQHQLRALWVDEPRVAGAELDHPETVAPAELEPAERQA